MYSTLIQILFVTFEHRLYFSNKEKQNNIYSDSNSANIRVHIIINIDGKSILPKPGISHTKAVIFYLF